MKLVIYDLDGTLLEAFEDIRSALNFALEQRGLPKKSLKEVRQWVGDGIVMLVKRALGTEHADRLNDVVPLVAEYYKTHPAGTSKLYPGVRETLTRLRKMGMRQAILTNKPHAIAVQACAKLGLGELVDRVQGEDATHPLKPDPESAMILAREFGVAPSECVIVGDGKPDVDLARTAGMKVIGCAWGATSPERMESFKPDAVIERMEELAETLERRL